MEVINLVCLQCVGCLVYVANFRLLAELSTPFLNLRCVIRLYGKISFLHFCSETFQVHFTANIQGFHYINLYVCCKWQSLSILILKHEEFPARITDMRRTPFPTSVPMLLVKRKPADSLDFWKVCW